MEKKSIFKKIDAFYTKSVKVIIGDIPLDDEKKPAGAKNKRPATPKNKIEVIKQTFTTVKSKFLNLGKPSENELLYKEVVKKENQEAKVAKQKSKKKTTNKKPTVKKITTKTSTPAKKEATKSKAKTTTKKPVAKKPTTIKKTVIKKTTTATKTTLKQPASKTTVKSAAKKKTPASKKTTSTTGTTKTTTKKKPVAKKSQTKATSTTIKTVSKEKSPKKSTTTTLSKRDAKIALYAKDITKHYGQVDHDFLTIIVKNLGPSIYKRDAELVSCSDPKELDTVRRNFLMKKLGIDASQGVLNAAIQDVCTELKGVRTKYRATFYYSLAKKFKKESALS